MLLLASFSSAGTPEAGKEQSKLVTRTPTNFTPVLAVAGESELLSARTGKLSRPKGLRLVSGEVWTDVRRGEAEENRWLRKNCSQGPFARP